MNEDELIKPYKDKDWLHDQYINQGKSPRQIAKNYNFSQYTVRYWLNKHNILKRTLSEAVKNAYKKGILKTLRTGKVGKKRHHWYDVIYKPNHPRAHKDGYVYEHLLIAEEIIGRPIKRAEIVHHIDLDKNNNSKDNLLVCPNRGIHNKIHRNIENIVSKLFVKGYVKFDKKKGEYKLTEKVI